MCIAEFSGEQATPNGAQTSGLDGLDIIAVNSLYPTPYSSTSSLLRGRCIREALLQFPSCYRPAVEQWQESSEEELDQRAIFDLLACQQSDLRTD